MRKLILLSTILSLAVFANAQIVNIPDANFKAALLNHYPVIDTNGDDEIQVSEASTFANQMLVYDKNISNLTGIEAFTEITSLDCSYNQLSILDVSYNITLTNLYCYNNQLVTLDLSNNTALTSVACQFNQLSELDLSNNTALTNVFCQFNQLSALDLSNNTLLTNLSCYNNLLNTLSVRNGNNTNLSFGASNNPDLYCIEVDDSTYSAINWYFTIDTQSYFSENCTTSKPKKLQRQEMQIYPNPNRGRFTIEVEGVEYVEVMDIHGRVIYEGKEQEIDLSNHKSGLYTVKVITEQYTTISRIVKQ